MGTNYGGLTRVVKDGEKVGFYKFVIEGIPRFNMKAAPVGIVVFTLRMQICFSDLSRSLFINNCLNNRRQRVRIILCIR